MILLINTSGPVCKTWWVTDAETRVREWQADRNLADGLIGYLRNELSERGAGWSDIDGIGVFLGPGSFTGLRIGLTVMNTVADTSHIAIVGETGEGWREKALERLHGGENDELVMPVYGREANITRPRK